MSDAIQLRYEGPTAVLTLNNPPRMNAVSMAMRQALQARLIEVGANDACRAIVLTGAGDNFCAGGDISEMEPRGIIEGRMRVDLATRIFKQLVSSPKPVICAVEGNAYGCGVSFVAASDYAVAATNAKFSCAFIKVGLMADYGGVWSIARRIGSRKAMEMCAFAETYSAEQALAMQLINQTCAPGKALEVALETANRFAKNPPIAMALLRSALNMGSDTVDRTIATETDYMSLLMGTEDFAEATRAFKEKRKPTFKGR